MGKRRGLDHYERIAVELIVALRGRRSQAAFSRHIGHASNAVHRWETRQSWPTAARFLGICEGLGVDVGAGYRRIFQRSPKWLMDASPTSAQTVAALLQELRGRTPIADLAAATGVNRYTFSKWLRGTAEPNLPRFLQLVDVISGRLLDLLSTLYDPACLPTVAKTWRQLQLARHVAYEEPWSHAVLRALQLDARPNRGDQVTWIAERLGCDAQEVERLLRALRRAGQVTRRRGRWVAHAVERVDTGFEAARARALKATWVRTAADRLETGVPGTYSYTLFEISSKDLERLRNLHLEYFRAMQAIVAESQGTVCVGLYCAQLLDLSARPEPKPTRGRASGRQPVPTRPVV